MKARTTVVIIGIALLVAGAVAYGVWVNRKAPASVATGSMSATGTLGHIADPKDFGDEGAKPKEPPSPYTEKPDDPNRVVFYRPGGPNGLEAETAGQVYESTHPSYLASSTMVRPGTPSILPPPASVDPTLDTDHDGLTDAEEARLKTDPKNPDTDGDGLTDEEEVKVYHTNPRTVDTDGDGLTDEEEVKVYHTNPNLADTDGDGFSDGVEVSKGYNPLGPGKL
jgi:hypothetical protein